LNLEVEGIKGIKFQKEYKMHILTRKAGGTKAFELKNWFKAFSRLFCTALASTEELFGGRQLIVFKTLAISLDFSEN
jgi:hypothetical protein